MENFTLTDSESALPIKELPDAVKLVCLNGPEAREVADMALHKNDLAFALECLEAINVVPDQPPLLRQALWRSSIVHYFKCFGGGVRISLDEKAIYKTSLALEVFEYFLHLRNRHVVHDVNSFAQSIPCAALNDGSKPYKIEKIICRSSFGDTLNQEHYNNLHSLIVDARNYVHLRFDELCDILTKKLEAESYKDLCDLEEFSLLKQKFDKISKPRKKIN